MFWKLVFDIRIMLRINRGLKQMDSKKINNPILQMAKEMKACYYLREISMCPTKDKIMFSMSDPQGNSKHSHLLDHYFEKHK